MLDIINPHNSHVKLPNSETEHPPDHTIIIEANITANEKEKSIKIDNFWRHRILSTCGDANVKRGRGKCVDPALCLYYGARFICITDNKALSETVPRGNGTMCRFRSVKVKENAISLRTRIFHGRRVTTVNANDVEYIECEVIDNTSHIKKMTRDLQIAMQNPNPNKEHIRQLQQKINSERDKKVFHMTAKNSETLVTCRMNKNTPKLKFKTNMSQFPINLADAVTGHKLQGRTLEKIVITAWGLDCWRNWEYTVLSRVKSRKGLFLLQELDLDKSYGATQQFKDFISRLKTTETATLDAIGYRIEYSANY